MVWPGGRGHHDQPQKNSHTKVYFVHTNPHSSSVESHVCLLTGLAECLPPAGARRGGQHGTPGTSRRSASEPPACPRLPAPAPRPPGKHIFVLNNLGTRRHEMRNGQNQDASHLHRAQIEKLLVPPIVENTELKGDLIADSRAEKLSLCYRLECEVQSPPARRAKSRKATLL